MKDLFSNLVVAVSGSEASVMAAKYAILLARECRARLTGVCVVDTATIKQLVMTRIFAEKESRDYERSLAEDGRRHLDFFRELAESKSVKVETELRSGAVFTEILACADERKADAILLGGWERDRDSRDIITVTHREIIHNARCPVVIVKDPMIDSVFKTPTKGRPQ